MSVCGHSRADQPIHSVVSNGSELKVWLKAAEAVIISYLEIDPGRHRLGPDHSSPPERFLIAGVLV
jgi:hypothetical protein